MRESATQEHLARYYHAIENGPAPLTHRQLVALAGDVYRFYTEGNYENPGTADQWRAFKGLNRAVIEGRIQSAPPIIPGETNDQEVARELFGERLTAGINALPPGQVGPALEQRFGLLVDWVLTRYGLALDDAQRALFTSSADPAKLCPLRNSPADSIRPRIASARVDINQRTVQYTDNTPASNI